MALYTGKTPSILIEYFRREFPNLYKAYVESEVDGLL